MALVAYTVTYVALSTSGLLLLRRSLPRLSHTPGGLLADLAEHPQVIAGGALYALSFLTFLLALRRFELSLVYRSSLAAPMSRSRSVLGSCSRSDCRSAAGLEPWSSASG